MRTRGRNAADLVLGMLAGLCRSPRPRRIMIACDLLRMPLVLLLPLVAFGFLPAAYIILFAINTFDHHLPPRPGGDESPRWSPATTCRRQTPSPRQRTSAGHHRLPRSDRAVRRARSAPGSHARRPLTRLRLDSLSSSCLGPARARHPHAPTRPRRPDPSGGAPIRRTCARASRSCASLRGTRQHLPRPARPLMLGAETPLIGYAWRVLDSSLGLRHARAGISLGSIAARS